LVPVPPTDSTHRQILKSSALVGGSSVVNVLVGIIRLKFTAVFLGPLGVGLFGAYTTILGPLSTLAGMGITSSGVRQIAEAAAESDQQKIARSLLTVRRASRVCGLLGMILTLALAYPLSIATFGNADQVLPLCILSATLFIGSIAGGLGAIIQGLRRIRDMAAQSAIGAVLGLPVAIALMIIWGVKSIVPMMLAMSLSSMAITWWFARRVTVVSIQMSWRETWFEAIPMLKLGLVFMSSGLATAGVAYVIRVMIIRKLGLEANGVYTAAWTLSSYYVGFILSAMGADFYPRLTGVNKDDSAVNRMVNEQTEVGLLMALPGILATLTLGPVVINLFYTAKFLPAVELLQWQALGVMLRVVSWPIAFLLVAKSEKSWFLFSELTANVVLLVLTWIGIGGFGINGAGMAFLAMYGYYTVSIYFIARHMTDFSWSSANFRLIGISIALSALACMASRFLPLIWSGSIGVILAAVASWYSLRTLTKLIGRNPLTAVWRKGKETILALGRLLRQASNNQNHFHRR